MDDFKPFNDYAMARKPSIMSRAKGEAASPLAMQAAAFAQKHAPEVATTLEEMAEAKKPEYTAEEINVGYTVLMTGPKATPPKWKTVRRIIWQMRRKMDIKGRRVVRFNEVTGKTLTYHPTKGLRDAI